LCWREEKPVIALWNGRAADNLALARQPDVPRQPRKTSPAFVGPSGITDAMYATPIGRNSLRNEVDNLLPRQLRLTTSKPPATSGRSTTANCVVLCVVTVSSLLRFLQIAPCHSVPLRWT
jgi:hypothetical protein